MQRNVLLVVFGSMLLSSAAPFTVPGEYVRKWTEDLQAGIHVTIRKEKIYCTKMLPEFYAQRQFEPVWTDKKTVAVFVEELSKASESGLIADDYHYKVLCDLAGTGDTPVEQAEKDMLLTDALLLYSSHLLNGKVNPETIDSEWKAVRRENNSIEFLEKAIHPKGIGKFLAGLEPEDESYQNLKMALQAYSMIAENGGWPTLPEGPTLKTGMRDSIRVPLLVRRLRAEHSMTYAPEDAFAYTQVLAFEVKKYQEQHGLDPDGNLGKKTTASMNIPVQQRLEQIIVNLERHRWLAQDLGERYVFVNIADYRLQVVEQEKVVWSEKVIVGKPFRKTPVFSGTMTYFVLNPFWTVPPVILYNDILPEMRKNPEYLASKNIKVIEGYGSQRREVDPATLDWSGFGQGNFPYTLRQEPGKSNALGQVKFMFPNTYNVYIHDTPSKELFYRSERTFSSGCIRLNNPLSLAEYLIRDNPALSTESIEMILAQGREHTVLLKRSWPIHIQYLTCWSVDGQVLFRDDVYARDQVLLAALRGWPSNL